MASHWACWVIVEQNKFGKFDVFKTASKKGRSMTLETDATYLTGLSCNCCTGYNNLIIFVLFSGMTLGTQVGVYLGSSSRYGVNKLSLRSGLSGAPLCEMRCTILVQFGVIVTLLMYKTVENSSPNTT